MDAGYWAKLGKRFAKLESRPARPAPILYAHDWGDEHWGIGADWNDRELAAEYVARFGALALEAGAASTGASRQAAVDQWLNLLKQRLPHHFNPVCSSDIDRNGQPEERGGGWIKNLAHVSAEACALLRGEAFGSEQSVDGEPSAGLTPVPDDAKRYPLGTISQQQRQEIVMRRRALIDAFLKRKAAELNQRVPRAAIWRAAGYDVRTDFERWQRCSPRATAAAGRNVLYVLTGQTPLKTRPRPPVGEESRSSDR